MTPYTLQSYLPLYLGQKVLVNKDNNRISVIITGMVRDLVFLNGWDTHVSNIQKIILRPLSSMTEEEKEQLFDHLYPTGLWAIVLAGKCEVIEHILDLSETWSSLGERVFETMNILKSSEATFWLLSKGFDIFGLKEKGLCLYPEEL